MGRFEDLGLVESIRKRPSMYVGSTEFFGFINYLVSGFDLMLHHGASWIEIQPGDDIKPWVIRSDANLPLELNEKEQVKIFETYDYAETEYEKPNSLPPLFDAYIFYALSEEFELKAISDGKQITLKARCGEKGVFEQIPVNDSSSTVVIEFHPDTYIFSVTEASIRNLHSYCRRNSTLYPGVSYRIKTGDELVEYKSENGLTEFFESMVHPYQVLHKPIHVQEMEDDLKVEAVFALHSWSEDYIVTFANKGRVPLGGTHLAGFIEAVAQLRSEANVHAGNIGILAIEHPDITFEGCIKGRVGNPEFRDLVHKLISHGIQKWSEANPEEARLMQMVERFQFADIW
ncbi:MAG: hypothetical protein KDA65_16705 [Planctomycetaceae bacterium]|nr:hypothetical protein [Planctomycetaceae bacterium]